MKYLNSTLISVKADDSIKISKHFNSNEFSDGMSEYTLIDLDLIDILEKIREKTKCPIKITSGYRSPEKQDDLRSKGYETASGISTHQVGAAVDIYTGKHTGEELEEIARSCGVKAVGVGKSFIHIDLRSDKVRRWTYSS